MLRTFEPSDFETARTALADAAAGGEVVRIIGAGSKGGWIDPPDADVEITTKALDQILEHNEGDLTAVLQAGVPLARAQRQFAGAGQMLALDPFLGEAHEATIGGIVASGDSGPLRHRYGGARDLIVGMTVALSDGTIARSGGKVIKNVAGYDLGKLFCGSFGTLGLILSVNVRLHPLPAATATAHGVSANPGTLAAAAQTLAAAPLELEALDVVWRGGRGGLLAQSGGAEAAKRTSAVARLMREASLDKVESAAEDADLWARQRARQRSSEQAIVRVVARPTTLAHVLRAADAYSATVVGRAALGLSFVAIDPDAVGSFVDHLPAGAFHTLLDAPGSRSEIDRWGTAPPNGTLELMRRVKARFDPSRTCNPGVFVGGI